MRKGTARRIARPISLARPGNRGRALLSASAPEKGHEQEQPERHECRKEECACIAAPVQKQLAAGVAGEPGERAHAERRGPHPQHRPAPACQRTAVRAIDLEEESDQGKARPSVEFQIHVHHDPAAIGPLAQSMVKRGKEQQNRDQHADGIGKDKPEQAVPCGAGNSSRSRLPRDRAHQAYTGS